MGYNHLPRVRVFSLLIEYIPSFSIYFMNKFKLLAIACMATLGLYAQKKVNATKQIEYIDLVHLSHTDYGYTDNPDIAHELHERYIDIGIDAVLESVNDKTKPTFCWTAETLGSVYEWWQHATPARRKDLLKAVKSGQFEITAAPFNVNPLHNGTQIDKMLNWVPEDLWNTFHPEVAIQDDVNGFPRALVSGLMDKGIRYFWSGLNLHWGGIFHTPPHAFWWKMPDGRKAFVWLGMPYWEGYLFFSEGGWRYAQRPACDTQFRTPRPGDMLKTDEESMRNAHKVCIDRLNEMLEEGYPYDFIALSFTNEYRCDNDAPFPALADFVAKWNEMGLLPRLNLTTVSQSMKKMEARVGEKADTYEGEWPDWWSFGLAAEPRALSASRQADMFLKAAQSPAWGPLPRAMERHVDSVLRDICLFYEHTLGTWDSTRDTYSLWSQGHFNATYGYAFRPYERAKWLLAQRVRGKLEQKSEGVYVMNPGGQPYTGWARLDPLSFVRTPYKSVVDSETGEKQNLVFEGGKAMMWVNDLQPDRVYRYTLSLDSVASFSKAISLPEIRTDRQGWPNYIKWTNSPEPLQGDGIGEFYSFNSLVGRQLAADWRMPDSLARRQQIAMHSIERYASFTGTECIETPHTFIYKQAFEHPSLKSGIRILEVYKEEARVGVEVKIDRLSNADPEIMYIRFPFAENCGAPVTSIGGMQFAPYTDQIPGTCTDFFAVDDWIKYPAGKGSWLWSSRDVAMVCFGGNQFGVKSRTLPEHPNELCAMVYNNMWEVNVLDDCIGDMSFKFDIQWSASTDRLTARQQSDAVRGYLMEPVIFVNPATRVDKHTHKHLNEIR